MNRVVPRTGGRVIMLDPDGRVLLINEHIEVGSHWLTPGGGVEADEDVRQAAVREVWEETGIAVELPPDATEAFVQQRAWSWDGVTYEQTDYFFVACVPSAQAVAAAAPTALEQQTLIGYRWWTVEELRATSEVIEPPGLADLVELVEAAQPTPRSSGRVLLLDGDGRVLLIEARVDVGSPRTHWITPGGGVDPGESTADAAVRELYEELGVVAPPLDEDALVHTNREVFTFGGATYDQTSDYFVLDLPAGVQLTLQGHDAVERDTLLGARWWSADELRTTTEVVWPSGLADILDRLAPGRAASA